MDEMTKGIRRAAIARRIADSAVRFSGEADALFERHLRFDSVVDPAAAGARDKFEAAAHAVRDMLTQRWIPRSRPTIGKTRSGSTISRWSS